MKEMREKGINDLRETRLEASQVREIQTKELREFSRKNDNMIKKIREEEKLKNIYRADKVRKQEQDKKDRQVEEREQR